MSSSSSSGVGSASASATAPQLRIVWLDLLRAVALGWVFLNHLSEQLFGFPMIGNPGYPWPPLAERVGQLAPIGEGGLGGVVANLIRYVGWAGDGGVSLFLIASGFALTWGLLRAAEGTRLDIPRFLRRRAERIYPEWWAAHLALVGTSLLIGWGVSPFALDTWLSFLGIRLTAAQLYYGVPAWWYVGLQLQLYLVYPVLWRMLRAWGPFPFLLLTCAVSFAVRGIGMLAFGDYLDAWSRGAIFITRLPEFAFGIALAAWMAKQPEPIDLGLRRISTLASAAVVYAAGTGLALFLAGMTFAPFLLGVGAFGLLYAPLRMIDFRGGLIVRGLRWVGRHSFSLYLVHQPCILRLVPPEAGHGSLLLRVLLAMVATGIAALVLERMAAIAERTLRRWVRESGVGGASMRVAAIATVPLLLVYGGDWAVRRFDPQEVWGWGERPSLEPDPELGWKLVPDRKTRLRWESYDYVVRANSLGFPGPEVPAEKPAGTFRILVTGDAFSSAEGVDTEESWPRLLEHDLQACEAPGSAVQVLNFAITGYGPNQYAAVLRRYLPIYRPDLVVIEFFVNEYDDVLVSDDKFRASIGFGQPDPDGLFGRLRAPHLRRFLANRVIEPIQAWRHGRPTASGYFFGYVAALERGRESYVGAGAKLVEGRMQEISEIARTVGAPVWLLMVPAPVQVCDARSLDYFPRNLDLTDTDAFDLEQPQRLTREIAQRAGFSYFDLRPALSSQERCPYQPRNLHWTRDGHSAVAAFVAREICERRKASAVMADEPPPSRSVSDDPQAPEH